MGLCPFPQAKKPKIFLGGLGRGERVGIINVPASAKLRKSEVDLLGVCPGPPTLQHQPKLPSISFSTLHLQKEQGSRGTGTPSSA